jgi:3-dehydroquinate synthase
MSLNNIYFSNQFSDFQPFIQQYAHQKVVVLVDGNTRQYCYPKIKDFLPAHFVIEIPAGEEFKNLETCDFIWRQLTDYQLDRKSLLINLGGGVIGDMGGFCAATYKRGIDFVQIPTTLLSQVDASVGGKLGVDYQGFKNHIGVFQEPKAVWIFPAFLPTLSKREILSGFAEMMKHCLIADAEEWTVLVSKLRNMPKPLYDSELNDDLNLWSLDLIRHSVAIKAKVVEADPTEKGLRKILNFGHTLGHAIESFYLEKPEKRLLHGEAIGIGMVVEAYISHRLGFLNENELNQIVQAFEKVYPKINLQRADFEVITKLTYQDKKNQDGAVQFSLLEKIGQANYNQSVSEEMMLESLIFYTEI